MKTLLQRLYTESSMQAQIYLECWLDSLEEMRINIDNEFNNYEGIEEDSLYYEQLYLEAIEERDKYSRIIRRLGLV